MILPAVCIPGVYKIVNLVNGKVYVGSAANSIRQRVKAHVQCLNGNRHANVHLQRAWNKYGESSFEVSVLEFCLSADCVNREQYWIDCLDAYKTGYNRCPKAGSRLGTTLTEETRRKISEAKRGSVLSLETRMKMSAVRRGQPKSDKAKLSSRLAHWSRGPRAKEISAKIAAANLGTKKSEECKAKISATKRKARASS